MLIAFVEISLFIMPSKMVSRSSSYHCLLQAVHDTINRGMPLRMILQPGSIVIISRVQITQRIRIWKKKICWFEILHSLLYLFITNANFRMHCQVFQQIQCIILNCNYPIRIVIYFSNIWLFFTKKKSNLSLFYFIL